MIRLGKVLSIDEGGEVHYAYLDGLGSNSTSYVSMPYVSNDFGMLVKPCVDDVIVVNENDEIGLNVIIAYIPQNYVNLPKELKAGEFLFMSKSKAFIYMSNRGNITMADNGGDSIILDAVNSFIKINSLNLECKVGEFTIYSGDVVRAGIKSDKQEFKMFRDGLVELYICEGVKDKDGSEPIVDDVVYMYLKIGDNFEFYVDRNGTFKIDANRFVGNFGNESNIVGDITLDGKLSIGSGSLESLLKSKFIPDVFNTHTHPTTSPGAPTSIPTVPAVESLYKTDKLESE